MKAITESKQNDGPQVGSQDFSLAVVFRLMSPLAVSADIFFTDYLYLNGVSAGLHGSLVHLTAGKFLDIALGTACCLVESEGTPFSSLTLVLAASLLCERK